MREPSTRKEPMSSLSDFEMLLPVWNKTERSKVMRHFPDIGSMIASNWAEMVSSYLKRDLEYREDLTELTSRVDYLASGLDSLKKELSTCKESIDNLYEEFTDRPIIKETRLFDIDEEFEVIEPLPIVIEESDDEVIATFPEVEVFAVGSGEAEAINNLKREVSKLYYELINTPDEQLGRVPQSWKRVLTKVVRRVGNT